MKTLLLMRHAKSAWDDNIEDDRDRPLSKRGKKNAQQMGDLLKHENLYPDLILASSALRGRQTAEYLIDTLKFHGDICYLNRLYMGEVEVYQQQLQSLANEVTCVLLIGHSPAVDTLLQMVTGKVESLPTAAIAYLELPINAWKDFTLEPESELVHLWRPKDL